MTPDAKPAYKIIAAPRELSELVDELGNARNVAIDMEADSMHHFQERVCLLQVATETLNVIVDPLALPDLGSLRPLFADPAVQKVFHGADYDVRSLFRDFNFEVQGLFDTQIACQFMGYPETGLEAVLKRHFGVVLDKRYRRRDWSRRPLPPEMLDYAAKDAVYLIPLAERLQAELRKKGRLEWVREECRLLSHVRPANHDGEPLFLRFRGAGRMQPRDLAILEELLALRREIARKKDRPLFKIFSNKTLLTVVQHRPRDLEALRRSEALSNRQFNMYADAFVKCVRRGLAVPDKKLPVYPRKRSPAAPRQAPRRVKRLKEWRDKLAGELGMEAGLVCNKALITELAAVYPKRIEDLENVAGMKQWQKQAFGERVLQVVQGKRG
jgi:ribonuclease D